MRVLHTSDWHLGHTLHGVSREYEHREFLTWLSDVLETESVDTLLIAGDIFDSGNPPAHALHQWYSFLAQTRLRFPELHMVAVGGNHDSPLRLDAANPLLTELRIHVVGALPRDEHGPTSRCAFALRTGSRVDGWILAIPFLRPGDLSWFSGSTQDAIAATYRKALDHCTPRRPSEPVIALGHAHLASTIASEDSERRLIAGNQDALPTAIFPDAVHYVAMGHLHLAQSVGSPNVRYSGSPIPLSLAERTYEHQVLLIDFDGSDLRHIRSLRVPRAVEFHAFPEAGFASIDECSSFLARYPELSNRPPESHPFLELRVQRDGATHSLRQRLHQQANRRAVRLARIVLEPNQELVLEEPAVPLSALHPLDVFRQKVLRETGQPPSEALIASFVELLHLVQSESP